jgi:hypothetical protein
MSREGKSFDAQKMRKKNAHGAQPCRATHCELGAQERASSRGAPGNFPGCEQHLDQNTFLREGA